MDRVVRGNRNGPVAEVFEGVHAKILRFFPELVVELGGDPQSLLCRVGINPEALDSDCCEPTYRQLFDLLELAAAELACPDFGMRLAVRQNGEDMFGPLGRVMRNSGSFGEALDYVAKHAYAHSLAARIWLKFAPQKKSVFVGHDILLDRTPKRGQAMEQLLLLGHLAAMAITDGQARAREVHFRRQPLSPLSSYRRYFGCPVRFGQSSDGVVFSEQDLACRIARPDARAFASATSFIDAKFTRRQPPIKAEVRGVIMQLLGTGDCTNDRVAAALNLHARTLHRRLRAEGTSFQKVKDEVRRDTALYFLLHTELDIAGISERLGFSEQSVMTRRCNLWFAASPTRVRSHLNKETSFG